MGHFSWKAEQVRCIAEGWRAGIPIAEIARKAGVSEKRVHMKASALLLGAHPSNHSARPATAPKLTQEPQEREPVPIRLHRISFETHRLPGEPESVKVAWR